MVWGVGWGVGGGEGGWVGVLGGWGGGGWGGRVLGGGLGAGARSWGWDLGVGLVLGLGGVLGWVWSWAWVLGWVLTLFMSPVGVSSSAEQKEGPPFVIEWIPDILPRSRVGELRISFQYGHQNGGQPDVCDGAARGGGANKTTSATFQPNRSPAFIQVIV